MEFPKPHEFAVWLTWKGKTPALTSILLNSHIDVVPVDEVSQQKRHTKINYLLTITFVRIVYYKKLQIIFYVSLGQMDTRPVCCRKRCKWKYICKRITRYEKRRSAISRSHKKLESEGICSIEKCTRFVCSWYSNNW